MNELNASMAEADRLVKAAARDAQCRDWTAERSDRVGFARLFQARYEIQAARQDETGIDRQIMIRAVVSTAVLLVVPIVLLLLAPHPADPLTLAGALAAGFALSSALLIGWSLVEDRAARRTPGGPAPIDDPYLYADLTRRIEEATVRARADDRADTVAKLGQALTWVSLARDELTNRTSPADR